MTLCSESTEGRGSQAMLPAYACGFDSLVWGTGFHKTWSFRFACPVPSLHLRIGREQGSARGVSTLFSLASTLPQETDFDVDEVSHKPLIFFCPLLPISQIEEVGAFLLLEVKI